MNKVEFKINFPNYSGKKKAVYVKIGDVRILQFSNSIPFIGNWGLHTNLLEKVLKDNDIVPRYEPSPEPESVPQRVIPIGEGYQLIGAGFINIHPGQTDFEISSRESNSYPEYPLRACFEQLKEDMESYSLRCILES